MKKNPKNALLEFFLPTVVCCVCGEKTDLVYKGLCRHCLGELAEMSAAYTMCDFCGGAYGRHMASCPHCFDKREPRSYQKAQVCYAYQDVAKEMLLTFKFADGRYLAATMAQLIAEHYDLRENGVYDGLVAVPMTKKCRRERGYNQSELLAKELSMLTGIPWEKEALVKVRETENQSSLQGKARRENVKDAFALSKNVDVKGASLILIDDVITTGATAHHCAKTLKKAGAAKVKVCTFCGGKPMETRG